MAALRACITVELADPAQPGGDVRDHGAEQEELNPIRCLLFPDRATMIVQKLRSAD